MSAGKKLLPTSTVTQARVMLYQPSQRPQHRDGEWQDTSFGYCRVTGRLGQRHADLLEAILWCAENKREVADGGIELLVDPAQIRKVLSDSRYSMSQIHKLISELRSAIVEIETPSLSKVGGKIIGGLIDHQTLSHKMYYDPMTRGERHFWVVRVGIALTMLLERDLSLYYDPSPIARLRHGISQAVARHILSHKNQPPNGWFLDTVILAVAPQAHGKSLRDARYRLKGDSQPLSKIGIAIESGRVFTFKNTRIASTVAQTPGSVAHTPDSAAQTPETSHRRPKLAGYSGKSD